MFFRYPASGTAPAAERSMDAAHFDRVANDPEVRGLLGGDGPLKLTPVLEDTRNYAFKTAHGGFILANLADRTGRYDVHSLFLPDGRGAEAAAAMEHVAHYMFTRTDCTEGRTTIPEGNVPAAALARRAGFELRSTLQAMPFGVGRTTKADFYALTLERWALRSAETLAAGQWFHAALESAKIATGSTIETHPEEPVHDRMAGAAVLMIMGGRPEKAVAFYNAWANAARYATITMRSKSPVVIDIGDAVIEGQSDGMVILKCR